MREIDGRLKLLKRRLPYHVLNVAHKLLCGCTCLDDIGSLLHNVTYMDALGTALIPSPTASGGVTRRFAEADVIELMEGINPVRPRLWRGRELQGSVVRAT